jgi:anti-sigma-K factor RskA
VNVKEYISGGAIESYVLGMSTEEERHEFESLAANYPEIAAARNAFEMALEEQMLSNAPTPPAHLKAAILSTVQATPVTDTYTSPPPEAEAPVRSMGVWKWVAAASLVLLAGAAWWGFDNNSKYNALLAKTDSLQQQLSTAHSELNDMKTDASLLQNPAVKMAAMKGTSNPDIFSTIYWDTTSKDVYLMLNNLPQPASDKQYQLWALLGGQPIDLGMIEVTQKRLLYRMKNVQVAEAFAITLEPTGGSAAPTSTPIVLSKL